MIIGIDIGTSYSRVAILKDGKAKEIKLPTEPSASIPSAVFVKDDGTLLIGRQAVAWRMNDPSRYSDNFKRDFGTDIPYLLGDKELTPDEIYVKYFEGINEYVKSFTGEDVTKAYITHPADYSPKKKKLLEQAAKFAGFNKVELIDEPIAAALSYFPDHKPKSGETLLVYDLGGGTFDLTLVEMTENGLRLLTDPICDPHLSGADFDKILYDDIKAEFSKEHDLAKALENDRFRFLIHEAALKAKIDLSSDISYSVCVPYNICEYFEYEITREHFNKLIESKVRHSCRLIEKIAKNAGLTPAQIDKVLCVGGSAHIPFVRMCVEETVCKPVLPTADPELAICLGAVLKEVVIPDMIIGIDIGTSYSSVAILKDGKAKEIKPPTENSASIPSAVYAKNDGTLLIGRPAVMARMTDPSCFKDNFKRDFGTDKPYLLGDNLTPDEIYVLYFKSFKESVKSFTGKDVTKAYITHPAGFSPKKKKLLEQAARFAGLSNIELLDEPTAAALSYFSDHMPRSGETLLVYDLGGGTFDLTLVEMTENGFRLLTDPVGDSRLGGADFDQILYDDIVTEFSKEHDLTKALKNDRFRFQIHEAAVNAKINLSSDTSALVSVPYGFGEYNLEYRITREHFNKLIESKVRHSCALIEKIAKNAGLTPAQIDKVLCVGGNTRIPFVTMCVEETVCKPALRTADPELAICLGAVLKEVVKSEAAPEQEPIHNQNSNPTSPPADAQELFDKGLQFENDGNLSEAVKWYRKAAEQGFAAAQTNLGFMYHYGDGIGQDYSEAVKWFRKAAEQGFAEAQHNLGEMYYFGDGIEQDYFEAVKWYRKAAEQGFSMAQNNLGFMYQKGDGIEQDYFEAVKWYRKAAKQGDSNAQNNLGVMYQKGYGIGQDYSEAVKWYRKAAEQGFAAAQHSLGLMYHLGDGIEQDYFEAAKWCRKAAEQEYSKAQYCLGVMYYYGVGVAQSDVVATEWFEKAALQGDSDAQAMLDEIKQKTK